MPLIDGVNFTDDEYRETFGDPGPSRPDYEARGYRDDYPGAVQDVAGHNYLTAPGAYPQPDASSAGPAGSDPWAGVNLGGANRGWAEDFISRNPGDYARIASAYASPGGGGAAAPSREGARGTAGSYGVTLQAAPYTPWTRDFVPPDPSQLATNPVVQTRLAMGSDAFQKSAAASGTLRTGGFAKALSNYGQQVATEEYSNLYDRAMQEFAGAYGIFKENQTIPFGMSTDMYRLGQDDRRIDQAGSYLDLAASGQSFGQDRTTRMDDFSIYQYGDQSYYDRLFRAAELGRP